MKSRMKRLCDLYIRRAGLVGALYSAVPTAVWFTGMFTMVPFRQVYVLRAVLSLVVGCSVGAFLNRFGASLWLIKHRSKEGPATVLDGMLVGAAIGVGIALLPTLTALIQTNHPGQARDFIIISWLASTAIGACFGGTLSVIGRKHIDRDDAAGQEK